VGLLDELEQEAQRLKAGADDVERAKMQREQMYRTRLEPGMVALHDYLAKLTKNLALLKPRKTFSFAIAGYGDVVFQVDHEYDLKLNAQPASKEITLSFPSTVLTDQCPVVEVAGTIKIKAVSGAFQRFHLGGLQASKKDANGELMSATYRAKGKIVSSAAFVADADSGAVRMTLTNYDQLGSTQTKSFGAEQFTESLFDEIGRYLVREPSNLFKEDLPEDFRKQLRTKVQQEELKRKWEAQMAERQREELARLQRENSITGRFGKVVADVAGGGGLFDKLKGLVKKDK
jgi:hypothetical protein